MITTTEIQPTLALAPFIRCYGFHEMDTCGKDVIKPFHASHETFMDFYFKDKPVQLNNPSTGQFMKGGKRHILGLGTQYNGELIFNGIYSIFTIMFRPTGFHKIFNFPTCKFTNFVFHGEDILDETYNILYDQLCEAKSMQEIVSLTETYLLIHLNKQKSVYQKDAITVTSSMILKNHGLISMDQLAYNANMSLRNFERHFIEEVGISPKIFCCITRFNHALSIKFQNPQMDWTTIGYQSGYFDQMHLIKDFKRFTGSTPTSFLKQTPLRDENFTNRVEA